MIFVVDPQPACAQQIGELLLPTGLRCVHYPCPIEFRDRHECNSAACLVLSLSPVAEAGDDPLRVVRWVRENDPTLPVIMTAMPGVSIPVIVGAMKLGVVDVLVKPVNSSELLEAIRRATSRDGRREPAARTPAPPPQPAAELPVTPPPPPAAAGFELLTSREYEILRMVVDGHASKQIARRLNISAKTVSNHRAHLLRKTGATNTADLVSRAVRLLDARVAA